MKDTYTLIAYKEGGEYENRQRHWCHYDSGLQMTGHDSIEALMKQAYDLHNIEIANQVKTEAERGYWEFHALLNGRWVHSFCFGRDTQTTWFQDYTEQDDNTPEYWEHEKRKEAIQADIDNRLECYRKELKEQAEKRTRDMEEARIAAARKEKAAEERSEKALLKRLQEKYNG